MGGGWGKNSNDENYNYYRNSLRSINNNSSKMMAIQSNWDRKY